MLLFTLVSVYSSSFGVFVLSFPCSAPPSFEMTRMAFSGGLDITELFVSPGFPVYISSSVSSLAAATTLAPRLSRADLRALSPSTKLRDSQPKIFDGSLPPFHHKSSFHL
ncbi:unnamed protein product [Brassica napus]|uniref:(rape) hypothetical protein n=1 Tax=Brassica napus TaxID=3708 RepID=A0A816UTC7_BRANA|nr:unnamed protein product [Brassica napus]